MQASLTFLSVPSVHVFLCCVLSQRRQSSGGGAGDQDFRSGGFVIIFFYIATWTAEPGVTKPEGVQALYTEKAHSIL